MSDITITDDDWTHARKIMTSWMTEGSVARALAHHRLAAVAEKDAEIERLKAAIKRQASAVRALHASEETQINVLRRKVDEQHWAVATLDSERDANALLTAEIEMLRELIRELADDLAVEVNDRWGYDERLKRQFNRDMDVVNRARAALKEPSHDEV